MTSSSSSIKAWKKQLPFAEMIFPTTITGRVKYWFWKAYTPFHPLFRSAGLALRLVKHDFPSGRQDFLIGVIASHITLEEFVDFLIGKGYGNHFIAWKDNGEIVSLRKIANPEYQYHIRIFNDGEIRAHYEYTPEYHPWLHYHGINCVSRMEEFLDLLGDKIVSAN